MRILGVVLLGCSALAQTQPLELDKPVERTIAAGETHAYEIVLPAGQFMSLNIEPRGLALTVTFAAPGGKLPVVLDNASLYSPPIVLSTTTTDVATARVELHLPAEAKAGAYEIKLHELRPAEPEDVPRLKAERIYHEGELLMTTPTGDSRKQAIEKFREALAAYKAAGDQGGQRNALGRMGRVQYLLGDSHGAIDTYTQVLEIARATKDLAAVAACLNNIGLEHSNLGEYDEALKFLRESVVVRREVQPGQESQPLNAIALTYLRMGDTDRALDYYEQALVIRRRMKDQDGEAFTLTGIGATWAARGEYQKAIDNVKRAAELWHGLHDSQHEAIAINNIGQFYGDLGDHRAALEYLNRSFVLRQNTGNRPGQATVLTNLGSQYTALGEFDKALPLFDAALAIWREIGNRSSEAAVLVSTGNTYRKSGDFAKARERYEQAQAIARGASDRVMLASATVGLSSVYLKLGDAPHAAAAAEEALAIARDAHLYDALGWSLAASARAEAALGNLEKARDGITAEIERSESARASVAGSDLRSTYLAEVRPEYELLIDILMRLHKAHPADGYDAQALAVSEKSRARGLLDLLGESRAAIREGVDPALLARERTLRAVLRAKAGAPEADLQKLITDYRDVENQIRARSPRYASLTQPDPVNVAGIRDRLLDPDTALLEYSLGEDHSYVWVVTRQSIVSAELPGRPAVEAAARKAYEALSVNGAPHSREALEALGRMVLHPVASSLTKKRLAVVSEGALQYIPFEAMLDKAGEPLIARHVIVGLPSASTLAMLRRQGTAPRPVSRGVIAFGDPVFDADDPRVTLVARNSQPVEQAELTRSAQESGVSRFERLRSTGVEAESIVALAGAAKSRKAVGFDASRQTATSGALSDYRIVHFATHALLNNRHPEFSGLVLSLVDPAGHPVDGFLRAYEIYNLRLGADLVVLSACQTALGEDLRGEGLIGLARGFMYAGAPRVVASLWSVPDRATSELMKRFYEAMLVRKLRPAEALRAAQLAMRNDARWAAPYNWAGFVLEGEWN